MLDRRRLLAAAWALLAWTAVPAQATAAEPVQVTDDRGRVVSLPAPPRRVVSLLPSLTETVCALGACDRLVGVDDYSNWPESVKALPHVGGLEDAQVETVVALRPDLVLAATSTRSVARLEALGLKILAIEPRSLADLRRTIARLDQALGTGQGATLQVRLDQELAGAPALLPPAARGLRVYFEVSESPYAASEASFLGELLARLGAVNVVPGALGPFPRINPEFVVRANPQVIMTTAGPAAEMAGRPGWRGIEAVRQGRVCAFGPREADLLVRPGPRLGEGLRLMARCLDGAGTSTGARTGGPAAASSPAPMAASSKSSSSPRRAP